MQRNCEMESENSRTRKRWRRNRRLPRAATSLAALTALLLLTRLAPTQPPESDPPRTTPYLVVLGIAQDAGYPHAGCRRACCMTAWDDPTKKRMVTCLGLVDPATKQRWMFEATPDFPHQLESLNKITGVDEATKQPNLAGIFLTHAHIGHYSGLMYLGRESLGARKVPVYAMPRMREFLRDNGPWSQLLGLENIELQPLVDGNESKLNERISVKPILVPHRDEFSETVGFVIRGPNRSALFLPDIDKWEKWETKIESVIATVDYAFLDASFYDNTELPNRDISEIPHPFIVESLKRFQSLPESERKKIHFIHLNHTNPAIRVDSEAAKSIAGRGMTVARFGEISEL